MLRPPAASTPSGDRPIERSGRAFPSLRQRRPRRPGYDAAMRRKAALLLVGSLACDRRDVDIELPVSGRPLSSVEQRELHRIAEATFREVRPKLDGLPARLTLIVRWGKDVIPETGDNGAAAFPG